jgi:lambda family phage minor tail protein L
MTILIEARSLENSEYIELYSLDLTQLGGDILRFFVGYNESDPEGAVYFNSNKYTPTDLKVKGFEWDGSGSAPTPKLSMATTNEDGINPSLLGLINMYNNLQGSEFRRVRTFKKYLDGQSAQATLVKSFVEDVYIVDRKSLENKYMVEFELSSILDQTNNTLPKNVVSESYCPWVYRKRNLGNTAWVYAIGDNACPYTGSQMFTSDGVTTTNPLLDRASKQFHTCCLPRYGQGAIYPFGGFVGASRPIT